MLSHRSIVDYMCHLHNFHGDCLLSSSSLAALGANTNTDLDMSLHEAKLVTSDRNTPRYCCQQIWAENRIPDLANDRNRVVQVRDKVAIHVASQI